MTNSNHSEKILMHVTFRIGGGYMFVHQGNQYGVDGEYRTGFGMVGIVGGVKLTQMRIFNGEQKGPIVEKILPAGVINVYVQCPNGEEYEYMGRSKYVAKEWPVKEDREWKDQIRGLNQQELQPYYGKENFVPPPILFSGFSVFAFFNYGTFSADQERIQVGSNMTTGQVIVKPATRVDFKVPADETLVISVATPRNNGGEIIMHQEDWLALEGKGIISTVEIGIEPLDPYASLPVLGYEGMQGPGNESL
jgi:hypothetical protein